MSNDPTASNPDAPWYIPAVVIRLAGGETLIRPGKAVQRAPANLVAKWFGVSKKTLGRLAEAGFIRECRPTPWRLYYYPAEIDEFLRRTEEDPTYWTAARRKALLSARTPREFPPEPPER